MRLEATSLSHYLYDRGALLPALAVVLLIAFLSYRSWTGFERYTDQLKATQGIVTGIGALLTSIREAETEQRGFLLTGDASYLDPYRQARAEIPALLKSLKAATISRPGQAQRTENLNLLVDEKLAELELTIELRRTKGFDAALVVVRTGRGKALMDQIRRICSSVQAEAYGRLTRDYRHALSNENESGLISILGCVSLFSLLLVANVSIQRGFARRQTLIGELQCERRALRDSESSFRQLADSMPQMVWTAAPDGKLDYYNRRWCDYTGMHFEESGNSDWGPIFHPDDCQTTIDRWKQAFTDGEPYEIEHRLRRAEDGVYRWHLGRALPIRDAQGMVVRWFGTCTDIEDHRRAEGEIRILNERLEERVQTLVLTNEQLARANEKLNQAALRLERTNCELQDFASVASHDLQEPLRKMQAFGDRLKGSAREAMDEQSRDYLDRMLNAAKRMQSLIGDLLKFARVTSQESFLPVDLAQVAREVLTDLAARIADTNARVEVGELPTVDADASQMRQLFQNLIGNALKFHQNGKPPAVRVYAENLEFQRATDGMFRLIVEDKGIGFDEKYLDRIFTVFQRLHGPAEYQGTGVGLAICRKIVQRHGGDITAKSTVGQGASFIVTLPFRHAHGHNSGIPGDVANTHPGILNAAGREKLERPFGLVTEGKLCETGT